MLTSDNVQSLPILAPISSTRLFCSVGSTLRRLAFGGIVDVDAGICSCAGGNGSELFFNRAPGLRDFVQKFTVEQNIFS